MSESPWTLYPIACSMGRRGSGNLLSFKVEPHALATLKERPVTISRRQFVSASSLSVAAIGLSRLPGFAQTPAAPGAAGHEVRGDPARRRLLHGQRRHHQLSGQWRRRDRCRQSVHADRRDLRGGSQAEGAEGHRAAHQHASPRRSHQRQSGIQARRQAHPRARELRLVAAQGRRAGRGKPAAACCLAHRPRCRRSTPIRRSRTRGRWTSAARPCTCATSGPATRAAMR